MHAQHGPFYFSCIDLPRRPGEMKEYELTFDKHERVGTPVLGVDVDAPIDVDLRIQAVSEGVLASGVVAALVTGECTRCLEPMELDVEENFTELYRYEAEKKSHKKEKEIDIADEDEDLHMDGDFIDLEFAIRDALLLDLPINPLCSPDCEGLCPDCGLKMADLPQDHAHEKHDIRWAALENFPGLSEGEPG
jgi:uncharacterized protein